MTFADIHIFMTEPITWSRLLILLLFKPGSQEQAQAQENPSVNMCEISTSARTRNICLFLVLLGLSLCEHL